MSETTAPNDQKRRVMATFNTIAAAYDTPIWCSAVRTGSSNGRPSPLEHGSWMSPPVLVESL